MIVEVTCGNDETSFSSHNLKKYQKDSSSTDSGKTSFFLCNHILEDFMLKFLT
jgi:hypothetical protein